MPLPFHPSRATLKPCFNEPQFEAYLKKVIRIALEEGKFDGIFFDNAYMACRTFGEGGTVASFQSSFRTSARCPGATAQILWEASL